MPHERHRSNHSVELGTRGGTVEDAGLVQDYWQQKLAAACNKADVHSACLGIISNGKIITAGYDRLALAENFAEPR